VSHLELELARTKEPAAQRAVLPALALAALALACKVDPGPQLRAEIAELKKARVESALWQRAQQEAEQAEAELAQARERSTADRAAALGAAEGAERRAEALRSQLEQAAQRNAALREELEALASRQVELGVQIEKRSADKRRLQQQASWVRDQALAFVENLGRDDGAEVRERRERALAQFAQRVRKLFPEADLRLDVGVASGPEAGGRPVRDELERLADRFTERFALAQDPAGTPPVTASSAPGDEPLPTP
jgi:DNA repair exonuclease SbcCD ATPase subunit